MKSFFTNYRAGLLTLIICVLTSTVNAQVLEWRLANATTSLVDPDGAGPATGSVTFTLQIHTVSGTVTNVNSISTGFAYQSSAVMIPTTPGCNIVSNPANITLSPFFLAGGFAYTTVNQCGTLTGPAIINTGGQLFDRRVVGTLDGTGVTLTTAWQDVFTVTLWTLGTGQPRGGYVIINSGAGGTPGAFTTYAVADNVPNEYVVNSLTFLVPLALGNATVPVTFTSFAAKCGGNGTLLSWSTAQESNSRNFEIQKSATGTTWETVANVQAAGNSAANKNYQQLDLSGGSAFYRIKQVDVDGQFLYTAVERSNCASKNISSVIYPVPARDVLNVVIKSDRLAKTQLMVYEVSGRLVRKVDVSVVSGNNTFRINTTGLAAGDYLIRSSNANVDLNKVFTIVN